MPFELLETQKAKETQPAPDDTWAGRNPIQNISFEPESDTASARLHADVYGSEKPGFTIPVTETQIERYPNHKIKSIQTTGLDGGKTTKELDTDGGLLWIENEINGNQSRDNFDKSAWVTSNDLTTTDGITQHLDYTYDLSGNRFGVGFNSRGDKIQQYFGTGDYVLTSDITTPQGVQIHWKYAYYTPGRIKSLSGTFSTGKQISLEYARNGKETHSTTVKPDKTVIDDKYNDDQDILLEKVTKGDGSWESWRYQYYSAHKVKSVDEASSDGTTVHFEYGLNGKKQWILKVSPDKTSLRSEFDDHERLRYTDSHGLDGSWEHWKYHCNDDGSIKSRDGINNKGIHIHDDYDKEHRIAFKAIVDESGKWQRWSFHYYRSSNKPETVDVSDSDGNKNHYKVDNNGNVYWWVTDPDGIRKYAGMMTGSQMQKSTSSP